ncbi:MAG: putative DNA modification/repair radical SAM protein [Halobacteriovoraceae bacterium]|nr:putative DNA modification/repair radical SAM protein [Halobacteriovoraceae bacterium]
MNELSLEKLRKKLKVLADAAKYDASCSSSGGARTRDAKGMGNVNGMGICHSYAPDGRCISLLKILLTNVCIYDCKFCVNRVSSDTERAKFTVDEIVWLTLEFYRRNYIEGLFLSSGIFNSSDETMEQLTAVARILRTKHFFNGYIHLKAVAGASQELIEKAGLYADRVSTNIEMPIQEDLDVLAPAKTISEAQNTMNDVKGRILEFKKPVKLANNVERKFAPAGQSTQMVVGATQTSDKIILKTSESLYSNFSLRRVFYSSYSPIPFADAILPSLKPSLKRENRLYQADWLIRFYGFDSNELFANSDHNLPLDLDPKTVWALNNRHYFPININTANREEILRIPGVGVRSVQKILQLRRSQKIRVQDLKRLGVVWKRAQFFVETYDSNYGLRSLNSHHLKSHLKPDEQLNFFDSLNATTGEI